MLVHLPISIKQTYVQPNQNNYRQKRFESGREALKTYAGQIQECILSQYTKNDCEMSYREFRTDTSIVVNYCVKYQSKLTDVLPGLTCSYSDPFLYATYRHDLPDDYGYILIFGYCNNSVYRFGPRVTWFPKGYWSPTD